MTHKTFSIVLLLLLSCFFVQAQENDSLNTALKKHLEKLRKHPDDQALRETIIKLVLNMKTQPAIPKEVELLKSKAVAASQNVTDRKRLLESVKAYDDVVLAAPWLAESYYNLAKAQAAAFQTREAISNYKLYLMAAPNASDQKEVLAKIAELEYFVAKQKASFRQTYGTISYGVVNPNGSFASNSVADPKSGFAKPGWSISFDVLNYQYNISTKLIHGFSTQTEFAKNEFELPYTLYSDSLGKVSRVNAGSTTGKYTIVSLKLGWGMAYRANDHFTFDILKVLYGGGIAISNHPTSLDSLYNRGSVLKGTIGSGIRFNISNKFGIMAKIEYSMGNQKYKGRYNVYVITDPKIGNNTLSYSFGILF
jgi:hypothetical protein